MTFSIFVRLKSPAFMRVIIQHCRSYHKMAGILGTRSFTYTLNTSNALSRTDLRGIMFDLDGTLTIPVLDFALLRQQLGIVGKQDILEFVNSKPPGEKEKALQIVEDFEEEGRRNLQFQPGLLDMLNCIDSAGVPKAVITRNSPSAVDHFMEKLPKSHKAKGIFSHMLTRDFLPCKPAPDPLLHICKQWNIDPTETIMMGDGKDDILAGKSAGSVTVLLNNNTNTHLKELADLNVDSLNEFVHLLKNGFSVMKL